MLPTADAASHPQHTVGDRGHLQSTTFDELVVDWRLGTQGASRQACLSLMRHISPGELATPVCSSPQLQRKAALDDGAVVCATPCAYQGANPAGL